MRPLVGLFCLFAAAFGEGHAGGVVVSSGHPGTTAPGRIGRTNGTLRNRANSRYGAVYGYAGLYGYGDYLGAPTEFAQEPRQSGGAMPMMLMGPQFPAPPPETAHPVIHEYGAAAADHETHAEELHGPVTYLIAFRDHNIMAAMTYWVDGGTLHYLDTDHREKRAPLSSVDRDMSTELNHERHVPFDLP